MLNENLMNVITDRFEPNNNFMDFLYGARNETTQKVLISTKRQAVIYLFKITHIMFSTD